MKKILSISFVLIYLFGSLEPSWVLIDFYWNRNDFTQKYCVNLDKGITQCRASCYLESLLKEERNGDQDSHLAILKKGKSEEKRNDLGAMLMDCTEPDETRFSLFYDNYLFDFSNFVFHPPKA